VLIEAGHDDGDDHHERGRDAGGLHPDRDGATNQVMHAGPVVENGERPKAEHGQVVAIDRFTEHLGQEIINRGEADRREPEAKDIVGKPPVDEALHGATGGLENEHDLGDRVEPGEPEQRG
jgi:hypothetical protein